MQGPWGKYVPDKTLFIPGKQQQQFSDKPGHFDDDYFHERTPSLKSVHNILFGCTRLCYTRT